MTDEEYYPKDALTLIGMYKFYSKNKDGISDAQIKKLLSKKHAMGLLTWGI